jgi:hypothetical protein
VAAPYSARPGRHKGVQEDPPLHRPK